MFNYIKDLFSNKLTISDLNNHYFFRRHTRWIKSEIEKIVLQNKLKEKVTKILIRNIFISLYNNSKVYVENNYFSSKKSHQIKSEMIEILELSYSNAYQNALHEGVPSLFIEKFKQKHKIIFESIKSAISEIPEYKYYLNKYNLVFSILNFFLSLSNFIFVDIERAINSLNGEIDEELKKLKI